DAIDTCARPARPRLGPPSLPINSASNPPGGTPRASAGPMLRPLQRNGSLRWSAAQMPTAIAPPPPRKKEEKRGLRWRRGGRLEAPEEDHGLQSPKPFLGVRGGPLRGPGRRGYRSAKVCHGESSLLTVSIGPIP